MRPFATIVMLLAVASAMAVPARHVPIVRTAANGETKTIYLHGDAFYHYTTDATGQWLDERTLLPMSAEQKAARIQAGEQQQAQVQEMRRQRTVGGELNLAPRGLIILVNYKDKSFTTPVDTIRNMINGEHFTRHYQYEYTNSKGEKKTYTVDSNGSAKQYFHDQSWGQYNPVFDIVGPVTVSKNMADYGANKSNGDDKDPGQMIKEACEQADAAGADFTLYDNDGDGKVDFVYVIYAGYGEADGGGENTIWPHNYNLTAYSKTCTVDGKNVDNYACSNELNYISKVYAGIGTFCHEFSHVLSLPDLYNTSSNAHKTLGEWDILDYGPYSNDGNTPPAYSAYERFYMGWLQPRVLKSPEWVTLHELNASKEALLLCSGDAHNLSGNKPNPATFYLIENRQLSGWDEFLPGGGMLITKIQYVQTRWTGNIVNNNGRSLGVDLIEADGKAPYYKKDDPYNGFWGKPTDAFPAGAGFWAGFAGHEVKYITQESNGDIRFKYRWDETDVDKARPDNTPVKILHDGQVLIIRNGITYTTQGIIIENQ